MELDTLYRTYRPLLLSVAYRMLGTVAEAEDAVQDTFVALSGVELAELRNPKAYLAKMVTNRALNRLKSAQRRRETYTGPWLPEPEISLSSDEPAERMIERESFGYALLVLLEELNPSERAVYVLRESLGFDYGEIAEILDKTEPACRKIASRAKAKLGRLDHNGSRTADDAEPYLAAFAQAVNTGEFAPFLRMLTGDAVLLSDGGGKVRAAIFPIEGPERIGAFFAGIRTKGSLAGHWLRVRISGQPGWLLERPGLPPKAICFGYDVTFSGIRRIYFIVNPDKLTRIER